MTCASCGGPVGDVLDFGRQPLSNRFLTAKAADQFLHPLVLGQCGTCALVQIPNPIPAEEMSARFDWLAYREPEEHLDDLASTLRSLPGIAVDSMIAGLTTVDDTLLARMRDDGFTRQWRLDMTEDLGCDVVPPGVEMVQRMPRATAARITARRGGPDVIIARYIVEHAHHLGEFLDTLAAMLQPSSYLVVEVPDCEAALQERDYSAVWEEHVLYFTAATLRMALEQAGFVDVSVTAFPYALQAALVAIARRPTTEEKNRNADVECSPEIARWRSAVQHFPVRSAALQQFLRDWRSGGANVVMFGAAQRGCTFVNLHGLAPYIDLVVDDHPHKQGMYMPGSALPIWSSAVLREWDRTLCLVAANPAVQPRLMEANPEVLDRGGQFMSIYPGGRPTLPV